MDLRQDIGAKGGDKPLHVCPQSRVDGISAFSLTHCLSLEKQPDK
jgi:hypothetical protein